MIVRVSNNAMGICYGRSGSMEQMVDMSMPGAQSMFTHSDSDEDAMDSEESQSDEDAGTQSVRTCACMSMCFYVVLSVCVLYRCVPRCCLYIVCKCATSCASGSLLRSSGSVLLLTGALQAHKEKMKAAESEEEEEAPQPGTNPVLAFIA